MERTDNSVGDVDGPVVQTGCIYGGVHLNVPSRRVGPRQLPRRVGGFVGRERDLEVLTDHAGAGGVVVISGTAGVGKTAVALHWAWREQDRFPDGQLYVNLRGFDARDPMDVAEAVRGFLYALDVPAEQVPVDIDVQVALYRSLLSGKRMIVVLDNARDTEQVRPLLPGDPHCAVLVTSRRRLAGLIAREQARLIALPPLSTDEAHQLLAHFLGEDRLGRSEAVTDLITRCAHLPIALTIAAARAVTRPTVELRTVVEELGAFTTGDGSDTDLRSVFSWSYRSLSPDAARLFRLCGLHPGSDIGLDAIASLAGQSVARIREAVSELVQVHLVDEQYNGRIRSHDLLRTYAVDLAKGDDRVDPLRRMLGHYLHTASRADRFLDPNRYRIDLGEQVPGSVVRDFGGYDEAIAWFIAEHRCLIDAVDQAAAGGLDDLAWRLAWAISSYLHRIAHITDLDRAGRTALASAWRCGDRHAVAHVSRARGWAEVRQEQHAKAAEHFAEALAAYRELGDRAGEANVLLGLCVLHGDLDQHTEVLAHGRDAARLFVELDNPAGEARAMYYAMWSEVELGLHAVALRHGQTALDLLRPLDDRHGVAAVLHALGFAHHHRGDYAEAENRYLQSVDLYLELGDDYHRATVLDHLGVTYDAQGAGTEAQATRADAALVRSRMRGGHTGTATDRR